MAEVILNNLTKRFGDTADAVLAVDRVNLRISDGEFLVLLGPSGCGKTTTLRMVAGLETVSDGEIYIGDRVVNRLPPGDRDIAFVFQFYALYPHLSVKDNISFPLRAQKVPPAEVEQRVQHVAERLKINHILNRRPNRLPSGEQQRVALGRAMVRQPQVFLMDEPLTNLDASLRADMRVELKHLQQELGTTMLYVTHDQVEAMSMSHRIAVMNQGVLQQFDTPLEIYNHPKTLFVATFIGSPPMNINRCKVSDGTLVGEGGFRYRVPDSAAPLLAGKSEVTFGVRAEGVSLQDGDAPTDLRGVVKVREPLGDETIYQVDTGGYTMMVKTPPKQMFRPGDRVGVVIHDDAIHLFDATTQQRIEHGEPAS
jgi:multiple sugar transport system ATP-binding protein